MSVVRKVIILNQPLKLFGFTLIQLLLLSVTVIFILWLSGHCPPGKLGGIPLSFWVPFFIFCSALVFVKATEIKPLQWWRNRLLWHTEFLPKVYVPGFEASPRYPDESIIEPGDQSKDDMYVVEA
jgi:hypothetical protein